MREGGEGMNLTLSDICLVAIALALWIGLLWGWNLL
jgi:hypothetical protein